jgi:hypothetical protein
LRALADFFREDGPLPLPPPRRPFDFRLVDFARDLAGGFRFLPGDFLEEGADARSRADGRTSSLDPLSSPMTGSTRRVLFALRAMPHDHPIIPRGRPPRVPG